MSPAIPIQPEKLLTTARELAGDGRGRPRATFLRRSISSAYYALFHCITREAAESLLSLGTSEQQLRLARTFGHRDIKTTCFWVAGRGPAPQQIGAIAAGLAGTQLARVASTFIDLQEARHDADYNHLRAVSKAEAMTSVNDAGRAIQTLRTADPAHREAFFLLLAVSARAR